MDSKPRVGNDTIKVLVFAHVPPPHHGQSAMVELLLRSLGGDQALAPASSNQCSKPVLVYHVDARFSGDIEHIGQAGPAKFFLLLRYCLKAIHYRFRFGVKTFFYVPSPPEQRAPLVRDWLVMALCRPFFPRVVYYWQAAGLGIWISEQGGSISQWMTRWLLGRPDLSIVLGLSSKADADGLRSKRWTIVPNAIPDPCPLWESQIEPARHRRRAALNEAWSHGTSKPFVEFSVLFMALCTVEKGLFDAVESIRLVNRALRKEGMAVRVSMVVAGKFFLPSDEPALISLLADPEFHEEGRSLLVYRGFVKGNEKSRLMEAADCFCLPTYYRAESLPLGIIEAMAYGLPIVTTRWRNIPDLLPTEYPGFVDPRRPDQMAEVLKRFIQKEPPPLRGHFLRHYEASHYGERLVAALGVLDNTTVARSNEDEALVGKTTDGGGANR